MLPAIQKQTRNLDNNVADIVSPFKTWIGRNPSPTMKFATQLTVTAMAVAMGRAEELNSSVTRNQGMEPGPVAKNTT